MRLHVMDTCKREPVFFLKYSDTLNGVEKQVQEYFQGERLFIRLKALKMAIL